ncbi:uncharacterized protein DUF2530 [Motilibacter rhizosphaerae]|uniref:Uncharacterized protein DUF2530 n=1 Tax=Motilibacter rhizosphaerae TaxID=598652 RepID=A0A4Q7NQB6_9ACTN|nr:DUF2530 domain-containing protein [Motilibacter rhizosphaerae]RZS87511.1 uncharacterized protein DUF2530 [Motilibacter rhizosphaerae]
MTLPEPPPADTSATPGLLPLDVDGVGVVTAGTVLWAVALVVLLPFSRTLVHHGHGWWIGMCAAGTVLGCFGIWYCRRRRVRGWAGR